MRGLLLLALLARPAAAQQGPSLDRLFDGKGPRERGGVELYGSYGHGLWYYAPAQVEAAGSLWSGTRPHDSPDFGAIYNGKPDVAQLHIELGAVFKNGAGVELGYARPKLALEPGAGPPALRCDGLNVVTVSALHRLPLIGDPGRRGSVAFLARGGVGLAFPVGAGPRTGPEPWRLGGWSAGVGAALRWTPFAPFFVELSENASYGRYRIPGPDGAATVEAFSLGTLFGVGASLPLRGGRR